ncbi:ACT1 [Symbiodinium sp. CCMP2592]|nr:ACT1 [Symbiodinium sp. CCMP2592]
MALSEATYGTNGVMDLLRCDVWRDRDAIPKKLIDATQKSGFRMLSIQPAPTRGARHIRLHSWYFIRHLHPGDLFRALEDEGRCSSTLRQSIQEAMGRQKVYHVVVAGGEDDRRFVPPGDFKTAKIVFSDFLNNLHAICQHAEELLFDQRQDPEAIRQVMDNPQFDSMLKKYFESGDMKRQQNLKLVGRLGGNLLHTCIEEGHLDTVQLLLDSYTLESHPQAPWRVLAEPLHPVGSSGTTAFHAAIIHGSDQALSKLLEWAELHNHDITGLKYIVEREPGTEQPVTERNCLQVASSNGELKCYNLLAPLFGKRLKDLVDHVDANGPSSEVIGRPRLSLICPRGFLLKRFCLPSEDWKAVLAGVAELKASEDFPRAASIRIRNVNFQDEASSDILGCLLDACSGLDLVTTMTCTFKTDKTWLALLEVLLQRLHLVAGGGADLTQLLPREVNLVSPSRENVAEEQEQQQSDRNAARLILEYINVACVVPNFLGAQLTDTQHITRFSEFRDHGYSLAAAHAVSTSTMVNVFVNGQLSAQEGELADWVHSRLFLKMVSMIHSKFFDTDELLAKQLDDPRDVVNPAAASFLRLTLGAWFKPLETAGSHSTHLWQFWGEQLEADDEKMRQLAPALDFALELLLKMREVLDYVLRRAFPKETSLAALLHECVPVGIRSRLPRFREVLEELLVERPAPARQRVILTAPASGYQLRPNSLAPR